MEKSITVTKIEKSASWGTEDPRTKEKKYFAVVTFAKGGSNKFVAAAIGSNAPYHLSYDLRVIYGNKCVDDDGKFMPKDALELFRKEYVPTDVCLYDIDLKGEYKVLSNDHVMTTARIAIYGSEEDARKLAFRSLANDIKAGRVVAITNSDDDSDEEDE